MWPWKPKTPNYQMHLLMVCTGNICRSPTAQAVMHKLLTERGLHQTIGVDSAGTHALAGSPPDARMQSAAARRGYDLSKIRARQFGHDDFTRFDRIVVMDGDNLRWLQAQPLAPTEGKLVALLAQDVPDPYYGAPEGFEHVLTLIEGGCQALLAALVAQRQGSG